MRKKIALIALALFGGILFSQCTPSVDKQLKIAADMMNKSCPMMVDSEIRLDKVTVPASKEIHYHYTLVNLSKSPMATEQLEGLAKPMMISYIKGNAGMKEIADAQVTFVCEYSFNDGEHITNVRITPEDYK